MIDADSIVVIPVSKRETIGVRHRNRKFRRMPRFTLSRAASALSEKGSDPFHPSQFPSICSHPQEGQTPFPTKH